MRARLGLAAQSRLGPLQSSTTSSTVQPAADARKVIEQTINRHASVQKEGHCDALTLECRNQLHKVFA
jgi:hypothetical protein